MTYNILEEIYHNNKFYYIEESGLLLQAKGDLPLPHHPVICYKKFNQKSNFDIVEEIPKGLEMKLNGSKINE